MIYSDEYILIFYKENNKIKKKKKEQKYIGISNSHYINDPLVPSIEISLDFSIH